MTVEDPLRAGVSAVTGEGVDDLLVLIDRILTADHSRYVIRLSASDGAARAFLHEHGDVASAAESEEGAVIDVRLSEKAFGQFRKLHPAAVIEEARERGRLIA